MRVGDIVNEKYELLSLLGEGGMGAVYEARHTLLNRKVALKFLHSDLCENQESQTRFLREAQAAAGIGSENIVQVIDIGTAQDGSPFLVMELLDGPDLRQVIGREKILDEKRAAQYAIQLCRALGAAHAQGITHRDLKPENVIVTTTAEGNERLKVLDFGIAKFHDLHLTATGSVIGSPHYMSPEQARGSKDVDHRADVYAVGAMLFEMVTGEKPYTGKSMTEILVKVVTEPPPTPRTLRPEVTEAVEQVILKAMARDREHRYASMAEFIDSLTPLLDGREPAVSNHPTTKPSSGASASFSPVSEELKTDTRPAGSNDGSAGDASPAIHGTIKPSAESQLPKAVITGAAALGVVLFIASGIGLCALGGRACSSTTDTVLGESRIFVSIEPGAITMDFAEDPGGGYYPGQRTITVTHRFVMLKTEVTQRQFTKLMGYNPSTFAQCGEDCPVESLTWHEAALFANRLSERRNKASCYQCAGQGRTVRCTQSRAYPVIQSCPGFRLPTEAEWALAACGQTMTHTYLGNIQQHEMGCLPVSSALGPIAWYCGNSNNMTHPVGQLRPNDSGLYDMLGNVSEWCNDWFGPTANLSPTDPTGAADTPQNMYRIVRGGGFDKVAQQVRCAVRLTGRPDDHNSALGFRLVRTTRRR